MGELIEAFPLQWPAGFERSERKKTSQFNCTLAEARDGVLHQIRLLRGTNVVISSSIPLKKDGQMQGTARPVDGDHGVAVYFTWKNDQYVLACDTYQWIWENLRGIEHTIDSIRRIERHGASDILKRAFSGFKQIGAGEVASEPWWEVLQLSQNAHIEIITGVYKTLAKKYHPDNLATGDSDMFKKVNEAYEKAKQANEKR